MRFANKVVGVAALAVLAGCSSWNPFASKPKGNLPSPLVEFKASMPVHSAWTYAIGKADSYIFSPVRADNTVIVAAADGAIARLEAGNGHVVWRVKAPEPLSAGVGTDGNYVVVGGAKGEVMAFDANGKFLWKSQMSSEVLSSPVVGQGVVVVRSVDNRIVGLDAKTGEKKWTVQRVAPALTLRNAPGMVVVDGAVIIAQPAGKLLALTLATGAPRWEIAVAEARGATELERVTDIGGTPVIFDKDVCVAAYQGRIGCYDVATGAARWNKDFSSDVGVAADQRFIFAADDKGAVSSYARETGVNAWRNDKLAYRSLSTPLSYGRAVAVGDGQGYIHFLSREDGIMLARVPTDGSPILSVPLLAGANLVFQTQSGTVTALAVE